MQKKSGICMRKAVTDQPYKQANYSKVQKHAAGNVTNNRIVKHLSFLIYSSTTLPSNMFASDCVIVQTKG